MILSWCTSHGLPHSKFLSWPVDDQQKVIATLLEERSKCSSCGTAEWEWEEDSSAYTPARHMCRGCQLLDAAQEETETAPGAKMVLMPRKAVERRSR